MSLNNLTIMFKFNIKNILNKIKIILRKNIRKNLNLYYNITIVVIMLSLIVNYPSNMV